MSSQLALNAEIDRFEPGSPILHSFFLMHAAWETISGVISWISCVTDMVDLDFFDTGEGLQGYFSDFGIQNWFSDFTKSSVPILITNVMIIIIIMLDLDGIS